MPKCEKCGTEVPADELYPDKGLQICEDCKIDGIKPPELHGYFSRIEKAASVEKKK